MKKQKLIAALSVAFLLASCSTTEGTNSSTNSSDETPSSIIDTSSSETGSDEKGDSSSSEEKKDDTVSFLTAYSQIAGTQKEELANAKSVTYRYEESTSALSNVTEQTYTNYQDGTVASTGTYTRSENGVTKAEDTFKKIATTEVDTYSIDNVQTSYNMFVEVTDFENDLGSRSEFQDKASKRFIINSEDDIGNLSEGEYILASDYEANAAANLTAKLANFLAGNVIGNIYVEQLGITGIKPVTQENGDILYSSSITYSYDEEGTQMTVSYEIKYTLNSTKDKLLSFDVASTMNYDRGGDDTYFSTVKQSGSIEYGEKESEKPSDILDPNNYFLSTVSSVKLMAKNANWNIVDVSKDSISTSNSTIYGFADRYSPAKAMDTQLAPVSSSNEAVIALEDGNFVVKGEGTTTLAFTYYRKIQGIYYPSTVRVEGVTVTKAAVEKISFAPSGDLYLSGSLEIGKTYDWRYSVQPSAAPKTATVTSSDPGTIEVEMKEEGTITLKAKKEGKATITITSSATEGVSVSKEFYVLGDIDYTSFLTDHTFFYDYTAFNIKATMIFNEDGTGSREIIQYESDKTTVSARTTDTFSWTLSGIIVTFSNFTSSVWNFDTGRIVKYLDKEGQPLGISANDPDAITERPFVALDK